MLKLIKVLYDWKLMKTIKVHIETAIIHIGRGNYTVAMQHLLRTKDILEKGKL